MEKKYKVSYWENGLNIMFNELYYSLEKARLRAKYINEIDNVKVSLKDDEGNVIEEFNNIRTFKRKDL